MAAGNEGVVMHVTAPDKKVASLIASKLVEEKLAACVQTLSGATNASKLLLPGKRSNHVMMSMVTKLAVAMYANANQGLKQTD